MDTAAPNNPKGCLNITNLPHHTEQEININSDSLSEVTTNLLQPIENSASCAKTATISISAVSIYKPTKKSFKAQMTYLTETNKDSQRRNCSKPWFSSPTLTVMLHRHDYGLYVLSRTLFHAFVTPRLKSTTIFIASSR